MTEVERTTQTAATVVIIPMGVRYFYILSESLLFGKDSQGTSFVAWGGIKS